MTFAANRTAFLALAAIVALSGCRIKDEDAGDPATQASATPEPTPSDTETAVASIIRPDVATDPIVETPPKPLNARIPFPQGGYDLSEQGVQTLTDLLDTEQIKAGWPIVLRGHTDSAGTDSGNLIASEKRAETVAAWLIDHGIGAERIDIIALGEQRPIAPNARLDGTSDEAGRARNRRVDIEIAPRKAKDSADAPPDKVAAADKRDGA